MDPQQAPPPQAVIMQFATGRFVSQCVGLVAELGIADHLDDGPMSAAELAAKVDVNADALYRVLRALSMVGVFVETSPKVFELTEVGKTLRSNTPGSMRDMVLWITSDTNYQCWGELRYSVKTGKPAANKVLGTDDVFQYFFHKNPAVGDVFNNAMTDFATTSHATAVEAYDFGQFKKIVDVGGGHGALMSAILMVNENVNGVVYDLPEVVAKTPELLKARGVADRCEAIGGDFFESVPAGADAYVSSVVLHDWSDELACKILTNIRKAMAPGAKVISIDAVIPAGNEPYPGKIIDLEMLVMTPGGRERTADEWAALYASAGLKLTNIYPTKSYTCVIEGVAA